MDHLDSDALSPAMLADCEAALSEWERLAVRDYWDAVVAEELAEVPVPVDALDLPAVVTQELQGCGQSRNSGEPSVLHFPGYRTLRSGSDTAAA